MTQPLFRYSLALLAASAQIQAWGADAAEAQAFKKATVHFEQNTTDGDYEVVFKATGDKDRLAEITITAPDGRKVVDFKAPERSTAGMRKFLFESPEPQDGASLKAAYPEGEYVFRGKSFSGELLVSKATLSHRLPHVITVVNPAKENLANKTVAWQPVPGASAYTVEIETEADWGITAELPASFGTAFAIPEAFLALGKKFKLAIGAVGLDGNISFIEASFTMKGGS